MLMKNLKLVGFLCGIVLFTAFGCEKDEQPLKYATGYIVGYDPCTINHQYRIGYVIISKDLKDTLVTYNFSDSIYKMPASVVFNSDTLYKIPALYFQNYWGTAYFPDTLRYKYGVVVSYSIAKESEKVYNVCTQEIISLPFYNQVIIKSAAKY
jgi:hypothetical protein